jgi:translation initiation factor 2 beta subunit (eIF-2beta)/eIF-5
MLRFVSSEPEFLICLNCETPTYNFEWIADRVSSVLCESCGNDEPTEFMSEAEFDEYSP